MDGAAKGKWGLAGIGGVLRNHKGEVMYKFSKHVGIKNSNEAEVSAILEALRIYQSSCQQSIHVKSDSDNAIAWMKSIRGPWKMHFLLNKIRSLVSVMQILFQHVCRPANGKAD